MIQRGCAEREGWTPRSGCATVDGWLGRFLCRNETTDGRDGPHVDWEYDQDESVED